MCHSTHSMSFQRGVFQAIDFAGTGNEKQVAQLWQRDRATAVLCLCLKSSLCSCRQLLYVRPPLHRTCLFMSRGQRFLKEVGHFRWIFDGEVGVAHQPMLVSENLSDYHFMWYQNIRSASFSFVTIRPGSRSV